MIYYCTNNNCPRAGWCKRVSMLRNMSHDTQILEHNKIKYMDPGTEYKCYVKNKAREIREREHINDILQDEESNRPEHEDPDRESWVREDYRADPTDDGGSSEGRTSLEDWFWELQRGGDRRGEDARLGSFSLDISDNPEFQAIKQRLVELQNSARYGISSSGFIAGQLDE